MTLGLDLLMIPALWSFGNLLSLIVIGRGGDNLEAEELAAYLEAILNGLDNVSGSDLGNVEDHLQDLVTICGSIDSNFEQSNVYLRNIQFCVDNQRYVSSSIASSGVSAVYALNFLCCLVSVVLCGKIFVWVFRLIKSLLYSNLSRRGSFV